MKKNIKVDKYKWLKKQNETIGLSKLYKSGLITPTIYNYFLIYTDYLVLQKKLKGMSEIAQSLSTLYSVTPRTIYNAVYFFTK